MVSEGDPNWGATGCVQRRRHRSVTERDADAQMFLTGFPVK